MGKENTVAIIGGEGAMGKMTNTLFQNIGFRIRISDVSNADSPSPREALAGSDVLFLSVSAEEIPKIIANVEDLISPEIIVIDNAGAKKPIESSLLLLDRKGASVCSTHPLTRPDANLEGKTVLIMPVGQNSERARILAERLYESAGMINVCFRLDEHDTLFAVPQQLVPHLLFRALERSIPDGFFREDIPTTPNFDKFRQAYESVTSQDFETSKRIIKLLAQTSAGKEFIQNFKKALDDLLDE